ncbi:MAG: DUF3410 domain-containing protein [Bacteroidales bacterium]|nr:DUF3410 domain-containing protein [Bacteroidales bacterium]
MKQYIASVLLNLYFKEGISLKGRKIGIVGVGHVGKKVAQLAGILGMVPLLNDPPRERKESGTGFVSLEEIQETCDIITFHLPLIHEGIDKTFHLADRAFFKRLSQKPFIINSSRGAVINTESIINALLTKKISGFAADVWENEPDLDLGLLKMTKIATPHIAGYSAEGKANGTAACVRAASQHFNFGLENWYPQTIPPPANPEILINAIHKTDEQVIAEAILASYNVMNDDAAFRADPSQFENLRNFYPIRREFEAFKVKIQNPNPKITNHLHHLGFQIIF